MEDLEKPPHGFKTFEEYENFLAEFEKKQAEFGSLPPPLGEATPTPESTGEPTPAPSPTATPVPVPEWKEGNIGYNYVSFIYNKRQFRISWEEEDKEIEIRHYPPSNPSAIESFRLPWQEAWKTDREALVRQVIETYDKNQSQPSPSPSVSPGG